MVLGEFGPGAWAGRRKLSAQNALWCRHMLARVLKILRWVFSRAWRRSPVRARLAKKKRFTAFCFPLISRLSMRDSSPL